MNVETKSKGKFVIPLLLLSMIDSGYDYVTLMSPDHGDWLVTGKYWVQAVGSPSNTAIVTPHQSQHSTMGNWAANIDPYQFGR